MQETRFDPWSGKTSHAAGQLSPCAAAPEPELESPGATTREAAAVRSRAPRRREPPLTSTGASPSKAAKTQHSQINKQIIFLQ